MSTGDKKVSIYLKKFLTQQQMTENFQNLVQKYTEDLYSRIFPESGVYRGGIITSSSPDTFDISTPLEATNSDGVDIVFDPSIGSQVPFENELAGLYHVGLKHVLIPDSVETNVRTGKFKYVFLEEGIGEKADPDLVVDDGDGTITIRVDSVTEVNVDNSGRTVKVFLKPTEDGGGVGPQTLITPFEDLLVQFDGTNNFVETTTGLGQLATSISTDPNDYQIVLIGPSVKRNLDLRLIPEVIFLGIITGVGAGLTPTVFDQTDRRVLGSGGGGGGLSPQIFAVLETDGTIKHDAVTPGKVTWSQDLIYKPFGTIDVLTVTASNLTLLDDEVAYVQVPDPFIGGTDTLSIAPRSSAGLTSTDRYWIFHRSGNLIKVRGGMQLEQGEERQLDDVVIGNVLKFADDDQIRWEDGTNTFHLDADAGSDTANLAARLIRSVVGDVTTDTLSLYSKKSDATQILNVNASLNEVFDQTKYRELLRATPNNPSDTVIDIAPAQVTLNSGEVFGLVVHDTVSGYGGGTIDFATGTITGGGTNFTPFTPSSPSHYFKYGVLLNSVDELSIIPPSGSDASSSAAPYPILADGVPVAVITVQDNGAGGSGTINNLVETAILRFITNSSGVYVRTRQVQNYDSLAANQTVFNITEFEFSASNTVEDLDVRVNGRSVEIFKDYIKTSSTQITFVSAVRKNSDVEIELLSVAPTITGGGGGSGNTWSDPIDSDLIPASNNTYDLGSNANKFKDGYFEGKLTVIGGVDPEYVQMTKQANDSAIPVNSIWVDNDGKQNYKSSNGKSSPISSVRNFLYTSTPDLIGKRLVAKVSGEIRHADKTNTSLANPIGVLFETVPTGQSREVQTEGFVPGDYIETASFVEGSFPNDGQRVWLGDLGRMTITPPVELSGHSQVIIGIWDANANGIDLQIQFLGIA